MCLLFAYFFTLSQREIVVELYWKSSNFKNCSPLLLVVVAATVTEPKVLRVMNIDKNKQIQFLWSAFPIFKSLHFIVSLHCYLQCLKR